MSTSTTHSPAPVHNPSPTKTIMAGIDLGFGETKVATPSTFTHPIRFFSKVGRAHNDIVSLNPEIENAVIRTGNERFFFGRPAMTHSQPLDLFTDSWIEETPFLVLFLAAIGRACLAENAPTTGTTIKVVTGLPVGAPDHHKELVKQRLSNRFQFEMGGVHFDLTTVCRVVDQPIGAFLHAFYDAQAQVKLFGDHKLNPMELSVGIVDIGQHTTDLYALTNLAVVPHLCRSTEIGMQRFYETLSDKIHKAHRIKPTQVRLYEAAIKGAYSVGGDQNKIDVQPLIRETAEPIGTDIRYFVKNTWGKAENFDIILLTGGGAAVFAPYLENLPRVHVVPDGNTANAIGYFKGTGIIDE